MSDRLCGMQMDAVLWILLPVFIAGGSALLSYFVMQARMDVALSKEREFLAEAKAEIRTQKTTMEERVRAAEEETRRRALDDFMQDFRVEERHYFREHHAPNAQSKSMVLQERLFFRNIPLSNWVEHEMMVEQHRSEDLQQLAKGVSVFSTKVLAEGTPRLVDSTPPAVAPQYARAFERAS